MAKDNKRSSPVDEAVILSAARTPIGRFQGSSAVCLQPSWGRLRSKPPWSAQDNPEDIEEIIMGNVVQAGEGQAPARQSGILSGIPATVSASTVNKVCGSGLKAAMFAAQRIRAGDADLFVAGGFESMSRAPYLVSGRSGELKFGNQPLTDALLYDGLWDSFENWSMGNAAEFIADEYEVHARQWNNLRSDPTKRRLRPRKKVASKLKSFPFKSQGGKGEVTIVDQDEGPRKETSLETLTKLKPAFKPDGKVTPGNSSPMNDGGAAVVISSRSIQKGTNISPSPGLLDTRRQPLNPNICLPHLPCHPQTAQENWLDVERRGSDRVERSLCRAGPCRWICPTDQGWDWDKVNVNGGAIALGHPRCQRRACSDHVAVCIAGSRLEARHRLPVSRRR